MRGPHRHRRDPTRARGPRPRCGSAAAARLARHGIARGRRTSPEGFEDQQARCPTARRLMVLVDTSVWIRFLAGRTPFAAGLDALLDQGEVLAHQLVYGELLIGDRGGRPALLESYEKLVRAPSIPHDEVVELVRSRKLHGRGVGWIDVHLLASALVAGTLL